MKRPNPAAKAIHSPKWLSGKESILSVCFFNHFCPSDHFDKIAGGSNNKQAKTDTFITDTVAIFIIN